MFSQRLTDGISAIFPNYERASLKKLAGDMSNRQYFRFSNAGTPLVAMLMAEASAKAEEGGKKITQDELPFINIQKTLSEKSVRVPQLFGYEKNLGVLVLEDFGDELVFNVAQNASLHDLEKIYSAALDELENIAFGKSDSLHTSLGFKRAFDYDLYIWEFMHFIEYALDKRLKKPLSTEHRNEIVSAFKKLSVMLDSIPRVYGHRDYHSRNLHILPHENNRIGVIDFQDALQAPLFYDLASLLRDSYVELPQDLQHSLIMRYRDQVSQHEPQLALSADAFRWQFDLVGTHRNLKAAGRFFFADEVKGMPHYLPDVPRTLGYVKKTLSTYQELTDLWKLLASPIDELIEVTSK